MTMTGFLDYMILIHCTAISLGGTRLYITHMLSLPFFIFKELADIELKTAEPQWLWMCSHRVFLIHHFIGEGFLRCNLSVNFSLIIVITAIYE